MLIIMNDFNFDENTINKLKNMMNNGELNDVISKIPPDMIQNFNSIINASSSKTTNSSNTINATNSQDNSKKATLNLNNIDMNTIVKMKSIVLKMFSSKIVVLKKIYLGFLLLMKQTTIIKILRKII